MKKRITFSLAAITALLVAGTVSANSPTSDIETDLIYGTGTVASSIDEVYIAGPSLQEGVQGDLLYGQETITASIGEAYVSGPSLPQDVQTDLIYGDQSLNPGIEETAKNSVTPQNGSNGLNSRS